MLATHLYKVQILNTILITAHYYSALLRLKEPSLPLIPNQQTSHIGMLVEAVLGAAVQ